MKTSASFKNNLATIISYLFILLFVYAAVSKLLEFQNFQVQVAQSPLLTAYAGFISVAVIFSEIAIAILLSIPKTRVIGLLSSFALMLLFTIYIFIILNFSPFVPCSCGGILEDLGWIDHLYFNIAFILLSIIALYLIIPRPDKGNFYLPVRLMALISLSVLLMAGLFLSSENIVAHKNNFIRRFPPFPAKRINVFDLKHDQYYFAGGDGDKIYLGNSSAPALITVIDTALKSVGKIHLTVKDTLFKFHNVQLRVLAPHFYLYDGTVPCLFKGDLKKGNAVLQSQNIPGFTKAVMIDSGNFIIRTLSRDRQHLISRINFISNSRKDNPALLQKQVDGIFDTDGTLQFDPCSRKFVYLYYYRNQYIVADEYLNLIHRANTIDTTTRANIRIEYVKEKKQRKFSAAPYMVNNVSALRNGLLFVNSALRGKYDTQTMWNNANYIDVYDIRDKAYLMSFYVYKVDGEKIYDMMATDDYLFVLTGKNLVAYRFSNVIKGKFRKELPAGNRSKTENL